jgi:GT2 family glycosyltransferase
MEVGSMRIIAPASAVIATRNRAASLARTLHSLAMQEVAPSELVVIDGSENEATKDMVAKFSEGHSPALSVRWIPAAVVGAAAQRNQGVSLATQPFIWFFDDDVIFEPGCAEQLWKAINADPTVGGVNAMIVNQRYHPPGRISRAVFRLMHGRRERSYAGKVIGPVVTLLPEDSTALPDVVPVEWLNTTCTIYRREALPSPPFDAVFTGYSLMEDVALSLRVGKKWKLANARTARIVHESQSGEHKSDARLVARMELINRYYVMRKILDQRGALSILRLFVWQLFQLASVAARSSTRRKTAPILLGQAEALKAIMFEDKQ